jgi:predicted AlkP superfamily pyrophosphatase or phosphodiesterase
MKPLAALVRRCARVALALALAGCAGVATRPEPPRLVVLVVIDGLPQRQLAQARDALLPDGFARFLAHGASFAQAHYDYAYTVTAAGHATLLTGAWPHRSGIIGNSWRDIASGQPTYCTSDPAARYIGHPTGPMDGTSPRKLKAEAVGDVLRRLRPQAKVIAISGKDRGAILPAGQAGTAYMRMDDTGEFASTTYYMPRHPAWVDAFNAAHAGGAPPPPAAADPLTLDFARAAIAGEQLGADEVPDILSVSLSGHDYVNHRFSAESPQSHAHLLQLDRLLQSFLADLDRTVGRDRYLAVLTADHGFMPSPETSRARGLSAGRLSGGKLLEAVDAALEQRFQAGKLTLGLSASAVLLDRAAIARHGLDFDAVAQAARDAVLAQPEVAAAYTRRELACGNRAGSALFGQMRNSWHPEVSGDVQYALQPYWMFGNAGATHGSPYPYDTHVPLLLWGPRWLATGTHAGRVEMIDLAPTLARVLGIPAPAASEGQLLPLLRAP